MSSSKVVRTGLPLNVSKLTPIILNPQNLPSVAQLIKSNDTYDVWDICMDELTLSMTLLHEGKATTGHSHDQTEEIYNFTTGTGMIDLGNGCQQPVASGDLVLVPKGVFHRVTNNGQGDLRFLCVFQHYAEESARNSGSTGRGLPAVGSCGHPASHNIGNPNAPGGAQYESRSTK